MIRNVARKLAVPGAMATALAIALSACGGATASGALKHVPSSHHGDPTLPKGGVEKPPNGSLTETGSTLLYPLWNIWAPGYQARYPGVSITTAGTGSGTGITDATNGTVDVGSSDAYLPPSVLQATPSLLNIPLAISVQVVAYNVPGVTAHLELSGKVLSRIYQGKITTWNDPAIASANPGVKLPKTPIVTLHRSDSSGDTFLFTSYLSDADPSGWGKAVGFNTTVNWPNVPGALAEQGNGGMVSACKATTGCIAYVGISYLSQLLGDGLNYAALQNGKGHYEMPTSAAVAAEASHFVDKTPPDGTISMIDGPVKDGYPIINYEYAIVNAHQSSAKTAERIRSVLEWAVNPKDGNSAQYLSQVNFEPLPPKIVTASLHQIEKIK